MKHLILILIMAFLGLSLEAQKWQCDKLYEEMALKEGVTMLSFSKKMLDAVNMNFDDEGNNEGNVKGDLHEVKIIIYNAEESTEPVGFRKTVLNYLPLRKYDKIEDEDGDGKMDFHQNHPLGRGTLSVRLQPGVDTVNLLLTRHRPKRTCQGRRNEGT